MISQMSYNKLKLSARNEGKIKSYESCVDVRAWSHDNKARDHYIREWIKSDMPICVIPVCTVSRYLRTMTWKSRGTSTPRCHPNCKSKIVLDSICTSCHAIKDCLKNEENFEKYFEEEEFETSHWPCERCLEALKSIKMFWRVISEKIFNISIPKNDDLQSSCNSNESVQSVAKAWQEELVQQALVVKNLTPFLSNEMVLKPTYRWKSYTKYLKKIITFDNMRFIIEDDGDEDSNIEGQKLTAKKCNCKHKATEMETVMQNVNVNKRSSGTLGKKINRCTSVRVKTVDFNGDTSNIGDEETKSYKNNLDFLQQMYNVQSDELRQLKTENISLKLQLQNVNTNCVPSYSPMVISDSDISGIPKPYEMYCDKAEDVKDIDSEMIITFKKCENENFKHVSVLQVLHKTNDSIVNGNLDESYCKKNEDPIKILTKVHNTFGAIVRRELTIANQKKCEPKEVKIDASYHTVHASRSVPSSSTVSSHSTVSDLLFASTTEV